MLILIDNYDSFTYNLYQNLADKVDTRVFRNDKITVEQIDQMKPSGIILSPGPGRPETAGICIELIKKLGSKYPILGICLGHQAIATAYGGKVTQHSEIRHGKQSLVHHLQSPLFENVTEKFTAGRYHSLIVELDTLPADLIVTAVCDNNTIMSIQHASYPCFGIQFHPESILTPQGKVILNNFIQLCNAVENHDDISNHQAHAA